MIYDVVPISNSGVYSFCIIEVENGVRVIGKPLFVNRESAVDYIARNYNKPKNCIKCGNNEATEGGTLCDHCREEVVDLLEGDEPGRNKFAQQHNGEAA